MLLLRKVFFSVELKKRKEVEFARAIFEIETLITYNVIGIFVTYIGVSHVWV